MELQIHFWWRSVCTYLRAHPLHPLLIAWFPVVYFYQANITQLKLTFLPFPLEMVTVVATVVYLVSFGLLKSWSKAALLATTTLLIFFIHGHLDMLWAGAVLTVGSLHLGLDVSLYAVWVCILVAILWRLRCTELQLVTVNSVISVTCLGLLLYNFAIIGQYYSVHGLASALATNVVPTSTASVVQTHELPDIYYLVFEDYGSSTILKSDYNFNNQPFIQFLTDHNFYIANQSSTNYPKTTFALATAFNMAYIQQLYPNAKSNDPELTVWPSLQNSKVVQLLKSHGYRYVHISSWYTPTAKDAAADVNLRYDGGLYNLPITRAQKEFINTTAVAPLLNKFLPLSDESLQQVYLQYQQEIFPQVVASRDPKFVFAHILIPHAPFIYDANCNLLNQEQLKQPALVNFFAQLQCTNKILEQLVTQIQANDPTAAIVLQTDEGPAEMRYSVPDSYNFQNASLDLIKERTSIFNAFYFPDGDYSDLYPTITSINTFPALIRKYLDPTMEYQPDKVYLFQDQDHYFSFIDATKKLYPESK